jgi:rSAM/selenodomain-associated transferase 2
MKLVPPPFLSIIVPVLNEEALIGEFLQKLRRLGENLEIIVVDGGSHDGTVAIAEPLADRVVTARRGRASQMNAGARVARGEVIWFLHADLEPPSQAPYLIEAVLADPRVAGGCFRLRFPCREWIYRVSDSLGNLGVNIFGFALGDHGIFCRQSAFHEAGGYPDVPILEDAEIYRRLRQRGRMVQFKQEIIGNPRAYETYGPFRTTALYFSVLALYVLGIPISRLNRIYRHFLRQPLPVPGGRALAPATRLVHQ